MANKMVYTRQGEEVDFGFLNLFLDNLKQRRRSVYITAVIGTLMALVVLLLLPNQFTATVKIMPESGGGTDKLASMAGSLLPEGVLSSALLSKTGSEGDNLKALAKTNRVLDSVLLSEYVVDGLPDRCRLTELWEIENIELARQSLLSRVSFTENAKSGIFAVSAETTDPSLSATIANNLVGELDQFKQEIDRTSAATSSEYLLGQIAEAENSLTDAETARADFLARNKNYLTSSDPQLNAAVAQLDREVLFHSGMIMRLKQLEATAAMEAKRTTPRLTIIEAARPPLLKSGPPRTKYLLICLIASILFPVGIIMLATSYRWYFPQATRHVLADSVGMVTGDVHRVFNRVRKPFKVTERSGV